MLCNQKVAATKLSQLTYLDASITSAILNDYIILLKNLRDIKKSINDTVYGPRRIIYVSLLYNIISLEVCYRCGTDSDITYSCVHTHERKMCIECYQFIHWAINNDNDEIDKTQ